MMSQQMSQSENEKFLEKKAAESQTEFVIDLEKETKGYSYQDLASIGELCVYNEVGNRFKMSELWSEFKTVFVFVRSFLCFSSKEYVEDLGLVSREALKAKQVRLVVIGCAHWKHIKEFRKATKYPYLIFCDTDYDIYNKLGLLRKRDFGNPNDSVHVKSTTFGGLMSSAYRAIMTSPVFDYQGDFDQQGGAIIVSPGPILNFCHIDKNARDHCPINTLLKIVGIEPVDFKKAAENKFLKN